MASNGREQRLPIEGDMEAQEKMGPVQRLVMEGSPRAVIESVQPQRWEDGVGNHQSGSHFENHEDEEGPIEQVVDPKAWSVGPGEGAGRPGYPGPGEQQVNEQRTDEKNAEPFMQGESGQTRCKEEAQECDEAGVYVGGELGGREAHGGSAEKMANRVHVTAAG
jgi:hypothetical protein